MKFYECNVYKTTKTSRVADIVFNPSNGYTGVIFKDCRYHVTHDKGFFAVLYLIARLGTLYDEYLDSCSMTTLKRYLSSMWIENENLRFIKEIEQELSLQNKHPELRNRIIRFKNPCAIKIQGSADLKSYGHEWNLLVLDSFYFEFKKPFS